MFKHASDVSGSHTYRKYQVSPMCECANTVYHSDSSLSGGSFTCCNRVYIPRLQEMREWDVQVWTFPANRMSCSALRTDMRATPGYLWRPHHGIWGLSFASLTRCHGESEGCFQQIGLFTWLLISSCLCLSSTTKPQSQNHREILDSCQRAGLLSSLFHFLPSQILFPPLHNCYKKTVSEAPDPHAWTRLSLRPSEVVHSFTWVYPASSTKVLACFCILHLYLRMEGE